MSVLSRPLAVSSESSDSRPARLLGLVMVLPLVDGIFPALVLAGAVDGIAGILEVGLLVFAGSATVAVILAEMEAPPRKAARTVLLIGGPLIGLAAIEAALAPTVVQIVDMGIFRRFAGLVVLAVAASTASARVAEVLPRPAVIVVLGLVASLDFGATGISVLLSPDLVLHATAAAGVGVAVALALALAAPWLRASVDLERFRFGSAVALGVLGLSILGLVPNDAPLALAVLAVTALFALDPGSSANAETEYRPEDFDVTAALDGNPGRDQFRSGRHGEMETGDEEGEEDRTIPERLPWL